MRKCITWVAIGVLAAGCQSVNEPMSVDSQPSAGQEETASLRVSFDACIERAAAITPHMQDCIEAEYLFQQARLDAALAKLGPAIAGEQQDWQAHKDAECRWDPRTEGQAQRLQANFCSLKRIALRADELEARLDH